MLSDLKKFVVQYALRQLHDFDKYKALGLVEQLNNIAVNLKDKKADSYSTVRTTLVEKIAKPTEHFKNYVLALLGDRDYKKSRRNCV